MPKAEFGSTKYLANKMKSKGLQRLRWYCQVCERQMRDENGFKMHTQSESHVRQMLVVGENTKKFLGEYSDQFKKDFVQLLRTSHGEKQVQINHFYQSYIGNKEHVHMNATKWPNLTEFAKYLGREGICRVEEIEDKGLHIAWVDDSPDALRRRDAIRRKEMQDKGDEEREQRMIKQQIKRANREAGSKGDDAGDRNDDEAADEQRELKREEGAEKIKLSFGAKPAAKPPTESTPAASAQSTSATTASQPESTATSQEDAAEKPAAVAAAPISMKIIAKPQTKNVFAAAKKGNALGGGAKKPSAFGQPKKMSEAERIMKEEMERKRGRGAAGFGGESSSKRPRM